MAGASFIFRDGVSAMTVSLRASGPPFYLPVCHGSIACYTGSTREAGFKPESEAVDN